MPLPADAIVALLRPAFPDAEIQLTALVADDDHWELTLTDASFQGVSRVEQHKRVYAALGAVVGRELHAIKVNTRTPE